MAAVPEPAARARCLVLGAGVQGLTCALRLWEAGWDVTILARDWLEAATSSGAGAIWEYPPFLIEPQRDARRWALASRERFLAVAALGTPGGPSGVRLRRSYFVYRSAEGAREAYAAAASEACLRAREGLPPPGLVREGAYAYGFSYDAPVICMRQYLPWLADAVGRLPGARLVQAALRDRSDVHGWKRSEGARLVVNCLGLGSRAVFGDAALRGVRGDLVYVAAPGVEERFDLAHVSDEDHPGGLTYAVPQGNGVLALAGTAEEEAPGRGAPRGEQLDAIVERGVASFPCLGPRPVVVGHWSGLRPQRAGGVRLEAVDEAGLGPVVHNYGHGGSGVVTSWGCAADVAALASGAAAAARTALRGRPLPSALSALSAEATPSRL